MVSLISPLMTVSVSYAPVATSDVHNPNVLSSYGTIQSATREQWEEKELRSQARSSEDGGPNFLVKRGKAVLSSDVGLKKVCLRY